MFSGSFASVRLARHFLIGSDVALKLFDVKSIKDPYVRKYLHREAQILSKLSHPNIVKLVEICSTGNIYCLALQYMPGAKTVFDVIQENGPMTEPFARHVGRQLVSALLHMHSKNILHRDLKLENVLLDGCLHRCLLIDFGLSSTWQLGQKMNTHCGSVDYAAPELFQHDPLYGPGIDVWSFGIVLFAMVLAHLPFESKKPAGVALVSKAIIKGLTRSHFSEMQRHLSMECSSLIASCLDSKATTRITMAQIASHAWIAGNNPRAPVSAVDQPLDASLLESIAEELKAHLITTNPRLTKSAILKHVAKRPYHTTGGCFNLLALQAEDKQHPATARSALQESAGSNIGHPKVPHMRAVLNQVENLPSLGKAQNHNLPKKHAVEL
jgi:serine/threonine protein kinase